MQRHRNPANGFRSNPIGIGGGVASGGQGYRNYNRGGLGRGQPPPPRRIDIFFEAGKLATEYLVSKGLLPPNPLNGRLQNSNLKNQIGGVDGVSDAVSGAGGGRRRFPDDIRARRTMGSFKNPGFEWNRENNRSSSGSEKVKGSPEKHADGESFSGSMEEQRYGKDGVSEEQKSVSGDLESKNNDAGNSDMSIQNKQNHSPEDNVVDKTPSSDISHQGHVESAERSDSMKNAITSTNGAMMDDGNQESEKPIIKEEPPEENNNNIATNSSSDLLTLIRFNKVPTRTRSSMTPKGSKSDSVLTVGDENRNKNQNSEEPENSLQDDGSQGLNHELEIKAVPSEEDHMRQFGQGLVTRSQSFPQRSSVSQQELGEGQHGYTRSSSSLLGRGEKRPMPINDITEDAKKPRIWTPMNVQSDDYSHHSNSIGDQSSSQPCNVYAEEKQLFPSSFKMCDLNLMGASDVNESHETNPVAGFSSIGQPKQEPVSVDFDLSMNNSADMADRHTRHEADNKEVEVIDLDCDSGQDEKVFDSPERREEAIFTDLGSFPDTMQRVSDMPQDSYGLMISELLDADIPNSTGPNAVNSMHNDISLQNEEGILGDDDSIYMSLGEIPIKQNKRLLCQYHEAQPTDSSPFPKVNVEPIKSRRGRQRSHGRGRGRGHGRSNTCKMDSQNPKHVGGKSSEHSQNNICYRCGMSGHWSRTCRAPKDLIEAYQRMIKEKEKQVEDNIVEDAPHLISVAPISSTHLEVCDAVQNVIDI